MLVVFERFYCEEKLFFFVWRFFFIGNDTLRACGSTVHLRGDESIS